MDKTALDNQFANLLAAFDDEAGTLNIGSDTDVEYNRVSPTIKQTEYLRNRYADDYALTIAVQLSALTAEPAQGSTLILDSTTYRILQVDTSPDTLELRLHLGPQHTGRR